MKTHIIHWKNEVTGRMGAGTRLLDKEEAERLAQELNEEYPTICHQAVMAAEAVPNGASANAMA